MYTVTAVVITALVTTTLNGMALLVTYLFVISLVDMVTALDRTSVHALIPLNGTELTAIYQCAMARAYTVTVVRPTTVPVMTTLNGLDPFVIYLSVM